MNRLKMWEISKLYRNGEVISTSSEYIDNHDIYMFELVARFKYLSDSEMFAEMKSKKSKPYEMFSVTKNLSGDSLGAYYVYLVYDKRFD